MKASRGIWRGLVVLVGAAMSFSVGLLLSVAMSEIVGENLPTWHVAFICLAIYIVGFMWNRRR